MLTLTLHRGCSFAVQWACEEKVSLDEIRNLGNLDFNFLWFYFLLSNYLPFKHLSGFLNYLPHQYQMALEMASILQLKLYSHHWVRTWLCTGRNLIQWEEKFYRWHLCKGDVNYGNYMACLAVIPNYHAGHCDGTLWNDSWYFCGFYLIRVLFCKCLFSHDSLLLKKQTNNLKRPKQGHFPQWEWMGVGRSIL